MIAMMAALLVALVPPTSIACPVPNLTAPSGGDAFARRYGASTAAFKAVSDNLATGFRRACGSGLIDRDGLLGVASSGGAILVTLENAPDANVASIAADRIPGGARQLVLEHPFVASDGSVDIPTADEIEEAIFCAVRGATPAEQEESGRCLPD